jgi:hypothetical protein
MEDIEIDFYLKIEKEVKCEINNIVVSNSMMDLMMEEFGLDNIKNHEKEEVFERMQEPPYNEIKRLKAELIVRCLNSIILYSRFFILKGF